MDIRRVRTHALERFRQVYGDSTDAVTRLSTQVSRGLRVDAGVVSQLTQSNRRAASTDEYILLDPPLEGFERGLAVVNDEGIVVTVLRLNPTQVRVLTGEELTADADRASRVLDALDVLKKAGVSYEARGTHYGKARLRMRRGGFVIELD